MILRVTQKLARKIKVAPTCCLESDPDPYADWTANLFIAARMQFIILTNTQSLYSVITLGRGITNTDEFVKTILLVLDLYLTRQRLQPIYYGRIAPAAETIAFSKTGDKRVLGSMNDLIVQAKWAIAHQGQSLFDAATDINDMPMGMLKYRYPKEAFLALMPDEPII